MNGLETPAFDPHSCSLTGLQLIEASAGTGKTWNIAALYLRLVLEGDWSVRQILVLSFTKAATAELRERIRDRLSDLEHACSATAPAPLLARLLEDAARRTGRTRSALAARVRLALQEFDQAAIQTIHGFCQRALADAPFVAGVPLEAELVARDADLAVDVVRDFWRQRMAEQALHPALAAALLARGEGPEKLASLLRRHQGKPLATIHWGAGEHDEAAGAAALATVTSAYATLAACWRGERDRLLAGLTLQFEHLNRNVFRTPQALLDAAQAWDEVVANGDPWFALAKAGPLTRLTRARTAPTRTGIKAGAQPLAHAFLDAAEVFLEARMTSDRIVAIARRQLLRELVETCLPRLAERKRAQRVQTFDDLLGDLYRVLAGPRGSALAGNLRTRFPVALIDEFQDTDPVQLTILRQIYQGSGLGVFLVGDPKQAIYGFRNADLDSYLDARREVEAADRQGAVATLRHNQRASEPLIAALNAVFQTNPHPFLIPSLRYDVVLPGAKPRIPLTGDPLPRAALQVWLLPRDETGVPLSAAAGRAQSFAVCADEIVRLLEAARGPLHLGERPLRAGDIAVLVRSHSDGRAMRTALARRGIASIELSQAGIFASLDARELERVLAAVVEPGEAGLALAAAATSLLGSNADDIDELRDHEAALTSLMLDFGDALARWQQRGFAAMFWPLLERRGVALRLLEAADGARRMTNLRHLAELLQAAAAHRPAPEVLLTWLREQITGALDDDELQLRLDSDADLVEIVTVHHAKGLEYPVVFCPALWPAGKPASRDPFGVREYHQHGRACIDYRSRDELDPQSAQEIENAIDAEAFAEMLRLVYVALTRAAQRCYLVAGAYGTLRKPDHSGAVSARTALNWLASDLDTAFPDWGRRAVPADALDDAWRALAARLQRPEALSVEALPTDRRRTWQAPLADPATLQAAVAPRIPARWRMSSYSALIATRTRGSKPAWSTEAEGEGRDHDALAAADGAEPGEARGGRDILDFPRGPEAGTCLHAILESVDFARPAGWPAAIDAALSTHGAWLGAGPEEHGHRQHPLMLRGWLADLAATPLPAGFRLDQLDRRRCLHEVEFHLPVAALAAARLRDVLVRHGHAEPTLQFDTLHGYLKGFIDLVVEHAGRWYVVDWKSNHLGTSPHNYCADRIDAEMATHDYALQALIYLLALDRYLRRRLRDYDRQRHLGGALYLFVRGVRPDWHTPEGTATGVWFLRSPQAVLAELDAVFAGVERTA